HIPLTSRPKSTDRGSQLLPTAAGGRGERHAIEKSADGGFRSVEIGMGIQPNDRGRFGRQAGECTHAAEALSGKYQRKVIGLHGNCHLFRERSKYAECRPQLESKFLDFNLIHADIRERAQPMVHQTRWPRSHTKVFVAGVIRHLNNLRPQKTVVREVQWAPSSATNFS